MKKCPRCGEEKPIELFGPNKSKKDGCQVSCKICRKEYMRQWYAKDPKNKGHIYRWNKKRKEEIRSIIETHLRSHPCVDCGNDNIITLDFDHVRGKKIMEISSMYRRLKRKEDVLDEIAKCEVRCSNCHRIATHKRRLSL